MFLLVSDEEVKLDLFYVLFVHLLLVFRTFNSGFCHTDKICNIRNDISNLVILSFWKNFSFLFAFDIWVLYF